MSFRIKGSVCYSTRNTHRHQRAEDICRWWCIYLLICPHHELDKAAFSCFGFSVWFALSALSVEVVSPLRERYIYKGVLSS